MKKYMTALVAAGLMIGAGNAGAAEKAAPVAKSTGIKLELGGYMNQYVGYSDADSVAGVDYQKVSVQSDTRINVGGSAKLRGGLEAGAEVVLVGNTDSNQVDESYGYLQGGFGKVIVGGHAGAAITSAVTAPNVGLPINQNSPDVSARTFSSAPTGFFNDGGYSTLSTTVVSVDDDNAKKITYFTPRMSGLQVGVSYLPHGALDSSTTENTLVDKDTNYTDGVALGANYVGKAAGLDVKASAGYTTISAPTGVASDPKVYTVGLNLGSKGVTVGGSYAKQKDGLVDAGQSTEGRSYDIGAGYETGPLSLSASYLNGKVNADTTIAGDDQSKVYAVSAAYNVGAGVDVLATVGNAKYDDESGTDTSSTFGVLGTRFAF